MKRLKLTKLSDDAFEGNHPNGINEGYVIEGFEIEPPTIGERYAVLRSKMDSWSFSTSMVTSPLDENGIFKTTYSTYKVEYEKDEE
jgi:hypothetical protein